MKKYNLIGTLISDFLLKPVFVTAFVFGLAPIKTCAELKFVIYTIYCLLAATLLIYSAVDNCIGIFQF